MQYQVKRTRCVLRNRHWCRLVLVHQVLELLRAIILGIPPEVSFSRVFLGDFEVEPIATTRDSKTDSKQCLVLECIKTADRYIDLQTVPNPRQESELEIQRRAGG